jgi:hypothetical protein
VSDASFRRPVTVTNPSSSNVFHVTRRKPSFLVEFIEFGLEKSDPRKQKLTIRRTARL